MPTQNKKVDCLLEYVAAVVIVVVVVVIMSFFLVYVWPCRDKCKHLAKQCCFRKK